MFGELCVVVVNVGELWVVWCGECCVVCGVDLVE